MSVRRNRDGREIWFERELGRLVPCHWKGWVLITVGIAAVNACLWGLIWLAGAMNKPDAMWPFIVIPIVVILTGALAERHAPSRRND